MDIQFAYNLERMLYYVCNENSSIVKEIMIQLEKQYNYEENALGIQLDPLIVHKIQQIFLSISVSDENTLNTMKSFYEINNILLCPHSAIGIYAATNIFPYLTQNKNETLICVLTAHPAKFEETVHKATGKSVELPKALENLKSSKHRYECLEKNNNNWRNEWINKLKLDIVNS